MYRSIYVGEEGRGFGQGQKDAGGQQCGERRGSPKEFAGSLAYTTRGTAVASER